MTSPAREYGPWGGLGRLEVSYSRGPKRSENSCPEHGLLIEPSDVPMLMQALQRHVSAFRTDKTGHLSELQVVVGVVRDNSQTPKMFQIIRFVRDHRYRY